MSRSCLRLYAILSCYVLAGMFQPLLAADDTLGIVTGPKTGTYYTFGKDIAQIAGKAGIDVDVKPSEGSIDNIKRINSSENAAIGIVQSDVLGFLSRSKSPGSIRMAKNLRMIFPFYNEEIHVLARNEIKTFADLQGKRVAVGEDGSGNMLTAINLFALMNVTPGESKKISSAQGVVAVLKGELDAAIFVGGKPVRLFKNLEDLTLPENQKYAPMLQQVHFIPLVFPKLLEEYKPAQITKADYNFVREDVPTIAVQAVMVSYDFSQNPNKKRCDKLAALTKLIRKELPVLQEKGHAKWKEVNLDAESGPWKKDGCVWSETTNADKASNDKAGAEKAGLMKILEKSKTTN
jgi:TRAP transporter TAXI family solute receptor